MATDAQVRATAQYRRRAKLDGLVRLEIQVPAADAPLIKEIAKALRGNDASRVRKALAEAVHVRPKTLLDFIASDLPDEVFDGVFDQPRETQVRDVDLW